MQQCPICSFPCNANVSSGGGSLLIECSRCGKYAISPLAKDELKEKRLTDVQIANLSGYVRQNQNFLIRSPDLDRLSALPTPPVDEKAAGLLIALGRRFPRPGSEFTIDTKRLEIDLHQTESVRVSGGEYPEAFTDKGRTACSWMAVVSAASPTELRYLLQDCLKTPGYITERRPNVFAISPPGWQRIAQLKQTQSQSTKAFIAMSFSTHLNEFFTQGIVEGVAAAGYEALRIDRTEHNNKIDDEIIAAIHQTKFVVADCTDNRAGVYYEAGFAKGLGHDVVWSVRKDQLHDVHFDTRQYYFIVWQPNELPAFAKALQNRIEATVGKGPVLRH